MHTELKIFTVLLLAVLLLSGCELYGKVGGEDTNVQGALPDLLRGEWVYTPPGSAIPSERYVIDNTTIQYGYGGGESDTDYKGNIRFVSNYSNTSGVIIIEYIEGERPTYSKYNGNSFFAIYYRNLGSTMVQLANAINLSDSSAPDTVTLDEAIEKFTRLKIGNYVDWGVVNPQKRVQQ